MLVRVLHILLPAALALYFLYRGMKKPVFLLGIPFLQVMRMSVFCDELRPFWMPGKLKPLGGARLIWLIWRGLGRSFAPKKGDPPGDAPPTVKGRVFLPEEWILVALALSRSANCCGPPLGGPRPATILQQPNPGCFYARLLVHPQHRAALKLPGPAGLSPQHSRSHRHRSGALHRASGLGVHIYDFPAYLTF